jgi:hypothetical protein
MINKSAHHKKIYIIVNFHTYLLFKDYHEKNLISTLFGTYHGLGLGT